MLSKNQIKLINQLNQKKFRKKHQLFFAEGIKTVKELLASAYELEALYSTADILFTENQNSHIISEKELKQISSLTTPQSVLGVFKIPDIQINPEIKMSVVLDGVRDPGNFGTIVRLCDWFGIEQIICSGDTVDCYNPKAVQATMGSIGRVKVIYTELPHFLQNNPLPIYGTFMDGENIYQESLPREALIVMGNEANGISKEVERLITHRIGIPQFGKVKATESLNVAMATSIVLNEFKRNEFTF